MSSPYLNNLISIAREELPQLAHDVENASTLYTVQDAAKRLLNILQFVVHHIILSDPSVAASQAAAARAAATPTLPPPPVGHRYVRGQDGRIYLEAIPVQHQVAMPMAAPIGHAPAVDHYPSQVPVGSAAAPMPAGAFGLPSIAVPGPAAPRDAGNQVTEVTITPQGSRVAIPGQPIMLMPPGVPIDTASMMGRGPGVPGRIAVPGLPGAPMAAIPLPATVPGTPGQPVEFVVTGGMTPEVEAALAGRSGDQPIMDASGGARNVTNE